MLEIQIRCMGDSNEKEQLYRSQLHHWTLHMDHYRIVALFIHPEWLLPLLPCHKPENAKRTRLQDIMGIFLYPTVVLTMSWKFYYNTLLAFVHVHTHLPVKLKTNMNETKTKLQQKHKKSYCLQFKLLHLCKVAISQHPYIL